MPSREHAYLFIEQPPRVNGGDKVKWCHIGSFIEIKG
jgi:hypothetical protein